MVSLSGFIFSCRMRLKKLFKHKAALAVGLVVVLLAVLVIPPVYQESWLDPFSTLSMANRDLHPHSITMIGMVDPSDPFHPRYYTNKGKIGDLLGDLRRSTPVSFSDLPGNSLSSDNMKYFTLHRVASKYHSEEDFALQYYPEQKIVRFGNQLFRINEAAVYSLEQIQQAMSPGWWNS